VVAAANRAHGILSAIDDKGSANMNLTGRAHHDAPFTAMADDHLHNVRAQFAALESGWAFFDNAGGTLPARAATAAMQAYLDATPVQLGATYAVSSAAGERLAHAHRAAARLFDEQRADEIDDGQIVFGSSATALANNLALSMRDGLSPGDEIVVTDTDHEANIGAWRRLADAGVRIREWRINPDTFELATEDLAELLNDRTRLVAMTHCSNILGRETDVRRATELAHAAGARICVDGVAFAPHRPLAVVDWNVDFYLFSLYKVYGPHNAVMYGKRDALLPLANINHFFYTREDLPGKLQPGAYGYEQAYATTGIVAHLLAAGGTPGAPADSLTAAMTRIAAHERALVAPLLDYVSNHPLLTLIGDPRCDEARLPTCAFTVADTHASEVPPWFDSRRIAIRWGHFYALRLIRALGLEADGGVVRVSLAHYNTAAEVESLIAGLDAFLAQVGVP
jgi:cysteine desulfurase family protein (TIGR01976 family)